MTYEAARSITGPFPAVLGASATVVGIVSGFGKLVGYGLGYVSGRLSDRTGRYWAITATASARLSEPVVTIRTAPNKVAVGRSNLRGLISPREAST